MMNPQSKIPALLPRTLMFAAMLALVVYVMHFALPESAAKEGEDLVLNPMLQVGLFLALTIFGALVGFWITFGDLVNRGEK
jgi:prepilin signal peptidase PulO-like enzyme (type II secretory pathway)